MTASHDITIRDALAADIDAVIAIDERCFLQTRWTDAAWASELAASQSPDPGSLRRFLRVATMDTVPLLVGFSCYWVVQDELSLLKIATHADRRRTGIAHAMMEDLLCAARRLSVERVTLEVRADNVSALALYQRFGFGIDGKRVGYYADGETAVLASLRVR